jgi:enoyl-CoA hydratase/carnithine racemase
MSEHVSYQVSSGVAVLRMQRPEKKNALSGAMYVAMTESLARAEADAEVRAVVLLGSAGVFTAGNDIGDFVKTVTGGGDAETPLRFLRALAAHPKPVVAGVAGVAIGIGTTLLLHCDLVYAAPSARFKTPFVDLGLTPEGASSLLMPQLMGRRLAAQWLLLGDEFDGAGALAAGLINAVVDDPEAMALEAASRLASKPPDAVRASKQLMQRASAAQVTEALDVEGGIFLERLRSPEAMRAFLAFKKR